MLIFLKIFAFLFAIFILVLVHEYGHFLAARLLKVKVLRFSIGFGKPFFKRISKKTGTEFVIAPWLLGGYVKLLDGNEGEVPKGEEKFSFDRQPVRKRVIIVGAGVFANLVFALLAFWLMFVIGLTVGKPIVGEIVPHTPAAVLHIKPGDEIVAINDTDIYSWQDVVLQLFTHLGDSGNFSLRVRRGAKILSQPFLVNLDDLKIDSYEPNPLKSLGIKPYRPLLPAVVAEITKNGVAFQAGFEKGDRILKVNNHKIVHWQQLIDYVKKRPKSKMHFVVQRKNKILAINLVSGWRLGERWRKQGYLGVKSFPMIWPQDMQRTFQYSVLGAVFPAVHKTWRFLSFNFIVLYKLVVGKISLHVLGGPIAIFQSAVLAFRQGVAVYLGFLALLSIMLCFVNLLPIPLLDGGAMLFLLIEAVRRKAVEQRTQMLFYKFGLVFLLLLFVHATVNDLMRFF